MDLTDARDAAGENDIASDPADEPAAAVAVTTHATSAIDDPGRLRALDETGLLDRPREERFDRLTELAARVLDAPVALISLVAADRQFFTSERGLSTPELEIRQTPLSVSVCQYTVIRREPLAIEDASQDRLVRDHPAVRKLGIVAYLGIPLETGDGHIVGTLCVIDHRPRAWTDADMANLGALAAVAVSEIEWRRRQRASDELAKLHRRLASAVTGLVEHGRSLAELVEGDPDPRRRHFAALVTGRTIGVQTVLRDLERIDDANAATASPTRRAVDLRDRVIRAVAIARASARSGLDVDVTAEGSSFLVNGDPLELERSMTDLLISTLHFAAGEGQTSVVLRRSQDHVQLEIRDTAPGIPAGELARIAARLAGATAGLTTDEPARAATIRISGGNVVVHHGPIRARSSAATGTSFIIAIPAIDPSIVEPAKGPAQDPGHGPERGPSSVEIATVADPAAPAAQVEPDSAPGERDAERVNLWRRLLHEEMGRVVRYRRPASLVIIEVTGLAPVDEDDRGHAEAVLETVAATLHRLSRDTDRVLPLERGRFGAILAETDQILAINYVERVRSACDAYLADREPSMRVALGWADLDPARTAEASAALADQRAAADR